jgi:uncharacterized protein (TIGR00730 family)
VATSSLPDEGRAGPRIEVGVIGSARIDAGDPRYAEAERLGRALAQQGWVVVTGGYGGLMGAASGGAAAEGGHTVGLPMSDWKHLTPHESNTELRWSSDYAERIRHLLSADVVVALPGGVGTLSEAAMVWAAAQTEEGAARLVLVGEPWARVRDVIGSELVVDAADVALARCVDSVDGVVAAIHEALASDTETRGPRG